MEGNIDFSMLYVLYYKQLFRISYSITRDMHMAEDVVHETFIKAIEKAETIEERSKVGAWLSIITTRTAIDVVRREKKKKGIPMGHDMLDFLGKEMNQNIEDEVETGFLLEQIKNAILKMRFEYQDVLMLKLVKGLKEHEIAKVLDINPCTVKTRIYRARKQLKLLFSCEYA